MSKHAVLSPSSAHRWLPCTGSVALCADIEQSYSSASDEGTFAHTIASVCLTNRMPASNLIGTQQYLNNVQYTVDETMAEALQKYIDAVWYHADGGTVHVEQRVPLSPFTGEDGAYGTADAIVATDDELQVHDLKYGLSEVQAEDNEQLMMYALGAMQLWPTREFKTVRGFIHQPRLWGEPKVATFTIEELRAFAARIADAALDVSIGGTLVAGDKQCKFCPAKATCPELARVAHATVLAAFDTPAEVQPVSLADSMSKVDLIEGWCAAVRAETFRRLAAGAAVPGYKMVEGRKGNRKWENTDVVETQLVTAVGDAAYKKELISVADAEKKLKKSHPTVWLAVANSITQSAGKPTVAKADDKRPTYSGAASIDDFSTIEGN